MVEQLAEAAVSGARLIVFPEMAASGYVWENRAEIKPFVETIPGPTTDALLAVTSRCDCYAVVGLPELDPGTGIYYNSAALIGPNGVIGVYRKTHLFADDPRWAREGNDGIRVFQTPIGNIAMLICMDAMYFEPSRIAALQDADIVAFPTNWVGGGNNPPSKTWCLRAWENGVYWIAANRSDQERGAQFTGGSGIIGPDGEVQQSQMSGEGIVYGKIPAIMQSSSARRRQLLETRRPQAYHDILLHPYLWKEGQTRQIPSPENFTIALLPYEQGEGLSIDRLIEELSELESMNPLSSNRLIVLSQVEFEPQQIAREAVLNRLVEQCALSGSFLVVTLSDTGTEHADCVNCYLIGPEGLVGHVSTVHASFENTEGEPSFRTFELPFGRVGLLTAQDAGYPESYRVLAKQGADIIAVSCNGHEPGKAWMRKIWAFENDAVLAIAAPPQTPENLLFLHRQVHREGAIPAGEVFNATFGAEQLTVARSRPFMRRLKTHLYESLIRTEQGGSER